jgi:hypothetical protein
MHAKNKPILKHMMMREQTNENRTHAKGTKLQHTTRQVISLQQAYMNYGLANWGID